MSEVVERLIEYIEYKGITPNKLETQAGITKGILSRLVREKKNISSDNVVKILRTCGDLNPNWLLLGAGEMINQEGFVAEPTENYNNSIKIETKGNKNKISDVKTEPSREAELREIIEALKSENKTLREIVELYKSKGK